ncbi:MAG: transcriptional regulator [Firmicutes bacterium]|nr:transcriptional regulator [Bacillota bacterium]
MGEKMELNQKIINFRERHNLTRESFANLIGATENDIICWERKLSFPNLEEYKVIDSFFSGCETLKLRPDITYGQVLIDKRKELGMTKKEFANYLNISVYKLSEWEEDISTPASEERAAINGALNIDIVPEVVVPKIAVTKKSESIDADFVGRHIDMAQYLNIDKAGSSINYEITYGQSLHSKRKESGLSKKDFAERLGVGVYKLSQWEEDILMPDENEKNLINLALNTNIRGRATVKKFGNSMPASTMQNNFDKIRIPNYDNRQFQKDISWSDSEANGGIFGLIGNLFTREEDIYYQELTRYFKDEQVGNEEPNNDSGLWFLRFLFSTASFLGVFGNFILAATLCNVPTFSLVLPLIFIILAITAFNFPKQPFLAKGNQYFDTDEPKDSYYIFTYSAFAFFLIMAFISPYFFA